MLILEVWWKRSAAKLLSRSVQPRFFQTPDVRLARHFARFMARALSGWILMINFTAMKKIMDRFKLKLGLAVSILFPGVFVFSQAIDSVTPVRFVFSFLAILSTWMITFALVDFKRYWISPSPHERQRLSARILLTFACVSMMYLAIGFLDSTHLLLTQLQGENFYSAKAWFFLILRICLFNALIILVKYLFDSNAEKRRKEMEIETIKRESVMALNESLKQQISPHFLFNSLTTLKSLVKQGSDQSLVFIDELAAVYRYMLNHYGQSEVSMEEEINFLKSYLHLLKLRFGESIVTHIDIPSAYLSTKIPQNTLQILIENAVKHNALSSRKPLQISIKTNDGYLLVENNLQQKPPDGASSQVGLSNIDNRYRILKGKNIIIEKDGRCFRVRLPMS